MKPVLGKIVLVAAVVAVDSVLAAVETAALVALVAVETAAVVVEVEKVAAAAGKLVLPGKLLRSLPFE